MGCAPRWQPCQPCQPPPPPHHCPLVCLAPQGRFAAKELRAQLDGLLLRRDKKLIAHQARDCRGIEHGVLGWACKGPRARSFC